MHLPNQQGQTIIEVLIAIVVILTGMLGVLALAQSNINNERLGTDRLVATQLAREAVEVVRATRDSNNMKTPSVDWDEGLIFPLVTPGLACGTLNNETLDLSSVCPAVFPSTYQLNRDLATGVYSHDSGGTATKFFRQISTRPICLVGTTQVAQDSPCGDDDERIGLEARAEVRWMHFDQEKKVMLVEQLYNWR